MALQFPASASIGQTYQSGSSPTYTYNGIVWTLSAGNNGIASLNAYTASLKTALQTTGSTATILGNLNVQGTQTALNQASLQITDKFIRVASGSLTSAQSDGAGIRIDGANVTMSWDSNNSQLTFNTQISASKFVGDGSSLTGISTYTNSDNLAYLNTKGVISGSSQVVGILSSLNTYTGSNDTKWSTIQNVTSSLINATSSYETKGRGIISGSSQLTSSYDIRYALSASYITSINGAISSSAQVTNGSGIISSSAQLPSGLVSGSSQLTASYDIRYTISGSIGATPAGTVSGSSQLTASFETVGRGIISSSAQLPSGLISGSSQLPTGIISGSSQLTASYDTRYTLSGSVGATPAGTISGSSQLTSSFDVRYALSGSGGSATIPAGTVSGSSQLTSSYDGRYLLTQSFNSFTASAQTVTTGSNSFNGNQVITGSLTITTGSFFASQLTANTASLYLTSGSNLYVQNNGIVEITGSLLFSGSSATFNVPALIVNGRGGDEGGEINLAVAVTNTTLQNRVTTDIWQNRYRIFEGSANAKGVFVDLSKAPAGVGGELTWKASGLVSASVDVTLGDLKARIPATGNKSLQLSTTTGVTYSVYGSGIYTQAGSTVGTTINASSPLSVTSTPTYLASGYNFGTAGATDTWVIMDTSNTIAWRITMILGSGFVNNMISIERLV